MSIEDRLEAVEARCRTAEDHLEILNLLNSYGPLVDSAMAKEASELWEEGGTYDLRTPNDDRLRLTAPDELTGLYQCQGHLDLTHAGSSHFTATPKISVNGDSAQAVGYSFVFLREGARWIVWRGAVNH